MKTHTNVFTALALTLGLATSPVAGAEPGLEKRIAFLDDFTEFPAHTELSLQKPHLDALMQTIAGKTVALGYIAVAGDASEQQFVTTVLPGFSGKRPQSKSLEGMKLEDLLREKKRLMQETLNYQHGFELWKKKALQKSTEFQEALFREQIETLNQFQTNEQKKGGDYRRSDVAGSVLRAAELFRSPESSRDYLVLATDGVDVPEDRASTRTEGFSAVELPPHVVLIFVSKANPENQPLFRDLPNPKHKLTSLDEVVPFLRQLEGRQVTQNTTSNQ